MANTIQVTSDTVVKLLIRRGTDFDRKNVILSQGELGFTTDTERVFVGNGVTLGGIIVGNKSTVTNTGKETISNPFPGDLVFETQNTDGAPTNLLYIQNKDSLWVNAHPVYGSPFSYATGQLLFNSQYLTLDTAKSILNLNVDLYTANLSSNQTFVYDLPSRGINATNKTYVDTLVSVATAEDQRYTRAYTAMNFLPLSGEATVFGTVSSTTNIVVPTLPIHNNDLTNKVYVDTEIKTSSDADRAFVGNRYLPLSGGTLTNSVTAIVQRNNAAALHIRQLGTAPALRIDNTNILNANQPAFIVDNYGSLGIGMTPVPGSSTRLTVVGNVSATGDINTDSNLYTGGRVGVGTLTPTQQLEVVGYIKSTGAESGIRIGTSDSGSTGQFSVDGQNTYLDYSTSLLIRNGSDFSEKIRVTNDGKIGVGVTEPVTNLQINDPTGARVRVSGANGSAFELNNANTRIGIPATNTLALYTSNNERARIDLNGNVGIGTASPTVKLDVNGNTRISGSLTTTGDINAEGDVTAFTTSDERLKNNITPITSALEKIDRITGVEYDWNTDLQSKRTGHDIGVLAQEIEAIIPEAVTTREDGYKAVNYEKIIPLLIQAIKELKANTAK
ncbi:Intramolecular chaperone auto-processing domain containing protein [uncultured Caudovirales phage]|uniref:Intramolecular chaperone auto-processing domain containing protein n=1 Tax=uncultured Caudovirales phage TaxID=2100421 RepID=A0A6J7X6U1_9CAUD|nr:Intramolecular chaperone auto-processing domain containing protein [uncultured Caudovirales phage]